MNQKKKAWVGILLMLWPVIRAICLMKGIPLPDIGGLGDVLSVGSLTAGTAVVATSDSITK